MERMKVLVDTCVWGGAKNDLEAAGHDVIWVGDWVNDPGDDDILAFAHKEGRILVTLDKDFGELVIVYGKPHSGIMRLVNASARKQGQLCLHVLNLHGEELAIGAIVTVEPGMIRVRPPATQTDQENKESK